MSIQWYNYDIILSWAYLFRLTRKRGCIQIHTSDRNSARRSKTERRLRDLQRLGKVCKNIVNVYNRTSLIIRIIIGLVIGALLGLLCPGITWLGTLGDLFVGALKAIAPVLVFALVVSALAQGRNKMDRRFGLVIFLYLISTLLASVTAVVGSFLFPQTLILAESAEAEAIPTLSLIHI